MDFCNCEVCNFDFSVINTTPKNVVLIPQFFDINYIYHPSTKDILVKYQNDFFSNNNTNKHYNAIFNNGNFETSEKITIDINKNERHYELPVNFVIKDQLRHSINLVCMPYCSECYIKKFKMVIKI